MLYIAKNHKGQIISIVSAKNKESVIAYYQGAHINYHSITLFDPNARRENEEMGYVTPILTTRIAQGYELKDKDSIIIIP